MYKIKCICKGVSFSIIVTAILLLIFSWSLIKTNIKEESIDFVIIIISGVSILIGTSISTIKMKKNGIINGIIISSIYMLVLYISSSVLNNDFSVNAKSIYMLLAGEGLGILGGIIGVNLNNGH